MEHNTIHNEMGRFWDEKIYRNELADRCQKAGFDQVATEVPIHVSYQDFNKLYSVDLLIDNAVIYELKTAKALTDEHQNQALNYLFISSITKAEASYEEHLRRFLRYASLKAMQWINFSHDRILFKTILQ